MSPLILLAVIAGLPLLLSIVMRVKPLYMFVGIVTGYFWMFFLGESAELTLRSLVRISQPDVVIRLALLLIPVILTLVLMRKTLSSSALPFQILLLIADSALLASFIIPILSAGTQNAIYQTKIGNIFALAHDDIIAIAAGFHLIVMFFMRPKPHHGKASKHHK